MNSSFDNEKRRSPRVQASLHLHLVYDDLDQLAEHYSKDISEGGIFVETDQPLPVGSKIKLRISIVHEDIVYINALGEVVHKIDAEKSGDEPGMGVKFIDIDADGQMFLKEFVLSRIEKGSAGSKTGKKENAGGGKSSRKKRGKKKAAKK